MDRHFKTQASFRCAAIVVGGMLCVVLLARWIDSHKPTADPNVEEERLYLRGSVVKEISLGFNGLVADWYWMRSLQYVGRKITDLPENVSLDDLGQLNLKLLAPLLDAATTLDPEFMEPYEYAAVVLPDVDIQEAIRITKKGIAANPTAWRLYQHLGYIYWQQHDFKTASETYAQGATLPGVPVWMRAMAARMAAEGGSRDTAREIYTRMYEQAEDTNVRNMARLRLLQLDYLEQRDGFRKIIAAYKLRTGHCPVSWRELEPVLRALRIPQDTSGVPLDPVGIPYLLEKDGCDVKLDPKSEIPAR